MKPRSSPTRFFPSRPSIPGVHRARRWEKEGLEFVAENPGENFYGQVDFGGKTYFTAVYPDHAVVEACVNCHNNHRDSPRNDLEVGDVMGGVVIRIPME